MTTIQHHPVSRHDPVIASRAAAASGVSWPEMVSHRDYLVRYAQRKLHDPMLAEDVVHDVFEAVLSGRASFAGRAALRSWLTADPQAQDRRPGASAGPLRQLRRGDRRR